MIVGMGLGCAGLTLLSIFSPVIEAGVMLFPLQA